jgi:hypothetical protein
LIPTHTPSVRPAVVPARLQTSTTPGTVQKFLFARWVGVRASRSRPRPHPRPSDARWRRRGHRTPVSSSFGPGSGWRRGARCDGGGGRHSAGTQRQRQWAGRPGCWAQEEQGRDRAHGHAAFLAWRRGAHSLAARAGGLLLRKRRRLVRSLGRIPQGTRPTAGLSPGFWRMVDPAGRRDGRDSGSEEWDAWGWGSAHCGAAQRPEAVWKAPTLRRSEVI